MESCLLYTSQTEEAEDSEAESEITDIDADEFDDLVEQAQNQDTYDEMCIRDR